MSDELDDILDDGRADLEARFRELEREETIRKMRGGEPAPRRATRDGDLGQSNSGDDLADIKAALDDDADEPPADSQAKPDHDVGGEPEQRYLLVLCPGCGAKNRTSLSKLRTGLPVCGGCKAELSFSKRG